MNKHRTFRAEFRAVDGSNGRQFWAKALQYEVVDDYGTIWTRGVFDDSVRDKPPVFMWGHSGWNDIAQMLGGGIDYRDGEHGPEALIELLDADENPNTNIVAGLMRQRASGRPFVQDVSVGFDRIEWDGPGGQRQLAAADRELRDRKNRPAVERMRKAGWDELSLVVSGAVPGAKVLTGVRSAVRTASGLMVPTESVLDLARRLDRGEITHDEAIAAIGLLGQPGDGEPADTAAENDDTPDEGTDPDELLAEAEAVLDALEG